MENMDKLLEQGVDIAMKFAPKLLLAVVTLIIGLWLINKLARLIDKGMEKRSIDASLRPFLKSLIAIGFKIMLFISVISMVGIEATSFIAVLGAAGLAIGLALSGTLQNFAGGVLILILKPYKVGDVLEAQGFIGVIHEIQIFHTIMKTWDNKTIIIPNGQLSNSSMVNYSVEAQRKVEWIFSIGYDDDIDHAKKIIEKTVFSDSRVLDQEGSYYINVSMLNDNSVDIKVRALVNADDYFGVLFAMNERVKKAFDDEGISIPFPQRDIHVFNEK